MFGSQKAKQSEEEIKKLEQQLETNPAAEEKKKVLNALIELYSQKIKSDTVRPNNLDYF